MVPKGNIFWNVFWLLTNILTSSPGPFISIDYLRIQDKLYVGILLLYLKGDQSFQWSVITFNLSTKSFKFNSSGLETLISVLPWYTKQRGYIVCIPITNYDRGFTQKRAGLLGPKQAERSFFYQVTIECVGLYWLPVAAWGYAPLCVWLHSANVTCNFSPYANQAVKLLSFPAHTVILPDWTLERALSSFTFQSF